MKKILAIAMAATISTAAFAQEKGKIETFDFNNFKLHVYNTNDVMADASYIVEGKNGLVLMELPLFKDNAAEFETYYKALNKPVEKVITDYHLGGTEDAKITMPAGMPEFVKGPIYGGMMQSFAQNFGNTMVDLPTGQTEEVAFGSTQKWAGVTFRFEKGASSDFPGASILIGKKVYYTHWTPSKAHISPLQISSSAAIEAEIKETETALRSGCEIFIGGHGGAARKEAVAFKLAYLQTMQKALATNKNAADFVAAMKKAYPALPAENNLEGVAKALYK